MSDLDFFDLEAGLPEDGFARFMVEESLNNYESWIRGWDGCIHGHENDTKHSFRV